MSKFGKETHGLREAWSIFKRRPRISDDEAREYIEAWQDDPISAVYSIWGNTDAVTDNPMLNRFVDENKHDVLEVLLRRIRNTTEYDDENALGLFRRIRDIEIDWPELDIIEKSFKADDILEGSEMTRDETEKLHLRSLQTRLEYGRYGDESAESALYYLLQVPFRDFSEENKSILGKMLRKEKKQLVRAILKTVRDVMTGSETDLDTIHPQDFWGPLFDTLEPLNLGWKELDVIKKSFNAGASKHLNEDLGNLAKLNVGPLINVLKQPSSSGRRGSHISDVGRRFYGQDIGSTSEIVDVGVLKKGMTSLRKAFKDNQDAAGFAVYIGGQPVMFGVTDAYNLGGSSRDNKIAYDLTKYQEIIDRLYAGQYRKPAAATARTKEPRYQDEKPRQYAGELIDTGRLTSMLDLIQTIGIETKQPVTAKIVMADTEAMQKRRKRQLTKNEIAHGTQDLRTRLAIYKNKLKPTAKTISEFIAMSLKNPGSKAQFAGTTYNLKTSTYDKIDPDALLRGKPFSTSYSSADPGIYDSLVIVYKFDTHTNQLLPIKAVFRDRTDPSNPYNQQEEVLDPNLYLVDLFKTRKFTKETIIPRLLEMFKARNYRELETAMGALERVGMDWPEFATIRKSIAADKAAK